MHRHPSLRDLYARQLDAVRGDPTAASTTRQGTPRGWLLSTGLDGDTAATLLAVLPPVELDDRQNDAPTLGALLGSAAAHPDDVELHGYLVGPARTDERLTAEGLYAYGGPDVDVTPDHHPGCECARLWAWVQQELGVDDAVRMPDEIRRTLNPWRPYEPCWSFWWD